MTRGALEIHSQITFLYYHDLEPIEEFYGDILGLELVEDQGWAKIYSVGGQAFLGTVTGPKGFHQPRPENAILLTLVVDDVRAWYEHLRDRGVSLLTEVKDAEGIHVRAFFLEDPGGYTLEVQQFLDPDVASIFV